MSRSAVNPAEGCPGAGGTEHVIEPYLDTGIERCRGCCVPRDRLPAGAPIRGEDRDLEIMARASLDAVDPEWGDQYSMMRVLVVLSVPLPMVRPGALHDPGLTQVRLGRAAYKAIEKEV